ncbi:MAG: arsenosugar biosynthesis radical SAM (seleno)protein ArsS [Planctomycetota bacterium]
MMTTLTLPIAEADAFHLQFDHELRAARTITTLQFNIGKVCNLACRHCHVDSSPARTAPEDNASSETIDRVLAWLADAPDITTVDITGGSPEMNPHFRRFVAACRQLGKRVMDRHNPTITTHTDRKIGVQTYTWIPQFLADHEVEVVASLPCYTADNVDKQRGRGSYDASVEGLLRLNDAGYGVDERLVLNLVYNPAGPSLAPHQSALEGDYHRELDERFGIRFNHLFTITNMPIARWRHDLERDGQLEAYMTKLVNAFNPATLDGLMCRHQINIDPQGRLYDCDFNQALDLPTPALQSHHPSPIDDPTFLWDTTPADLANRLIATADHCYGCTAGHGSSCGGALV